MEKLILKIQKRKIFGRKVKNLRKQGFLPGNIYGKKIKSQAVKINKKDFLNIFKQAGETGLVQLILAEKKTPYTVLIHNPQIHPVSGEILHVDFRQVDLTEKVQVAIPVELKGEAPAVNKGGVLVHLINEVEVEALPTDLPDKFEVDVSHLEEIGQSISIKDLKIDKKKAKILIDENQLVVNIEEPKKEEEKVVEEKPEPEAGEAKEETKASEEKVEKKESDKEKENSKKEEADLKDKKQKK